jgi:hypothetical protein
LTRTDATDNDKKLLPRGTGAPLVITIVVLAAVGAAYYFYYLKQFEYFTGRNLRLLSMLTAQVEGRVDMFSQFVRTQARSGERVRTPYSGALIRVGTCPDENAVKGGGVRRSIEETGQGWRLLLRTPTKTAQKAQDQKAQDLKTQTCATITVDDLVRPIFARRVGATFDVLLVARDDGTILYSVRPPPVSSTLLGNEEEWIDEADEPLPTKAISTAASPPTTTQTNPDKAPAPAGDTTTTAESPNTRSGAIADRVSGSTLLITNLKALSRPKGGWNSELEEVKPATLARATAHFNVTLGGTDYVLFAQPYTFARAAASIDGKQSQLVVCGLVSASRFRYDVSAVSTSVILVAIAVTLLALCCWPYLRIALIDPSQALTITDVVLLILCTIIGAAVLTLAMLDAFAYHGITQTADDQLEQFSRNVNDDFGRNVARAMDVLSKAETLTAEEAQSKAQGAPTQNLPTTLLKDPVVAAYPYIDSVAWIDDAGTQRVRFAPILTPPSDVSARQYFKLAKLERTWTVAGHSYVLEWVRSKSTGEVRAILAKKTSVAALPVIALATELIDISHAVRPPGVEMAIIDENGEVIYHSDEQRISFENFFAEADRNRDLRSAVVARRAGAVNVTYWGDDQSMYVMPLTGSTWTLVTFRAKRLTRVLNVEATLLTLVMLLLNATPYFVLYIVVLLLKPGYRAPRLWPDEARHGDYLRLSIILTVLLVLFCLNNYMLAPWSSFYGILIIPLLAIVTTYLVLHRTGALRRYRIATAVWIIVTAMLICHLLLAEIHSELFFSDYAAYAKSFLVAATLSVAVLTFLLIAGWKGAGRVADTLKALRSRFGYSTLYRFCGMLLLAIGVALPVVGFFSISRNVESELMVKFGQLRAAADLERRIDSVVTLNALPVNAPPEITHRVYSDILSNRLGMLFGSGWRLDPPVTNAAPWPRRNDEPETCPEILKNNWKIPPWASIWLPALSEPATRPEVLENNRTIPPWASTWLPALYEDSIAIQPLFEAGSADNLWHWCVNGRLIKLVRKIHFDRDVARFVWAGQEPTDAGGNPVEKIVIVSHLPRASFWKSSEEYQHDAQGDDPEPPVWLHLGTMVLIALPLLAIFWYAAGFVAKRVLLIDVGEPDWMARRPLSPSLGDHIFLVRRDRDASALTNELGFIDVSFETIVPFDNGPVVLEMLDSSEAGRNVRILDFEYGINDGTINEKKLLWLERLLKLADRTVIVVSSVGTAFVLTTPPPQSLPVDGVTAYFERWRTVLDRFVCVTAEELDLRHEEWQRRNDFRTVSQLYAAGPKTWLAKETAYNSFLGRLRKEIDAETALRRRRKEPDPEADRNRLLDEIGERAETYYAGLWATCRDDEKLLLYQLAHNGLANARNRRTLRRLIARGLVRRDPNLELFSESFRIYVLDAARRENIVSIAHEKRGASTWDSLRIPFFVIIISFVLLLFATQKDMLTTTTALATALTTGLPVLMKLVGVFTERRTDGKV